MPMPALFTSSFPVENAPFSVQSRRQTTVVIVDDHEIVREGLRTILTEDSRIVVIGEAKDGATGIELALLMKPDVVLMDVQMPEMSGLEATARLKSYLPEVKVIMLTMYSTDSYIVEAVRVGAAGYVLKDASREVLCETIKNVGAGHILIKSDMLRQALTSLVHFPRRRADLAHHSVPMQHLSDRETQVLQQVTEGKTNRQIGLDLDISEETVKKHMQSIITKLGASDRTHAACKAVRAGLVN